MLARDNDYINQSAYEAAEEDALLAVGKDGEAGDRRASTSS